LVYAHAGSLMTVHFDPVSLELQGTPVGMLGDLITMPASGAAQFNVSDTGTLVYLSGSARRIENNLDWIGSGMKEPQPFGMKPGLYQSPRFSPDGRKVALTVRQPSPEIWIYDLNRGTLQQMTFARDLDLRPEPRNAAANDVRAGGKRGPGMVARRQANRVCGQRAQPSVCLSGRWQQPRAAHRDDTRSLPSSFLVR